MNNSEAINSMQWASEEIDRLRRDNQILNAQMHVVNVFALAAGYKPQSQGMSEDVVWKMKKLIAELQNEMAAKAPAPPKPISTKDKRIYSDEAEGY